MGTEVRWASDDDLDAIWEIVRLGFGAGDTDRERWLAGFDPARTLLGLDDRGQPVALAHVRPFGEWFGGRRVAVGGYSPVAVLPEARGAGLARAVVAGHYADLRDRGEVLSGLYPAAVALYRSVGFELAGSYVGRRLPARLLASLPAGRAIRVRRGTPDDVDAVHRCYARIAPTRDGYLDRPAGWWDHRLPRDLSLGKVVYVVEGAEGELAGYAVYTHGRGRGPWDYSVSVEEVLADDPEVLCALWRVVASSGTQAPDLNVIGPAEDPLFLLLPDAPPDVVTAEIRWMLRLIDAPEAVAARGWAPTRRGRVHLALADEHAPWNRGRWILEVADGAGRLLPGGEGTVELGIGALSTLWAGYHSASALRSMGLLRSSDPAAVAVLDDLCASSPPTLLDFY